MKLTRQIALFGGCTLAVSLVWTGLTLWGQIPTSNIVKSKTSIARDGTIGTINFSSLSGPISSLGPVAVSDQDTAELYALNTVSREAWKKIRPASTAPEQSLARAQLLGEEADSLYNFTKKYPSSFWTPSIQVRLGLYDRQHGRYSRALELFGLSWEATKSFDIPEVKQIADSSLTQYLGLLSRLGRFETLTALFDEIKGRALPFGSDSDAFNTAREAYAHMAFSPGTSYRCGTMALGHAADAEYLRRGYVVQTKTFKSPAEGFSIQALEQISDQLDLGFVPVSWNDHPSIVVPSVVHWKANHYAAIVAQHGSWYTVIDPTFQNESVLLRSDDILAEASGAFLVPRNKVPNDWRLLTMQEKQNTFGRGYDTFATDQYDESCGNGNGDDGGGNGVGPGFGFGGGGTAKSQSCSSCGNGMPVWGISEPYASIWLIDTPLIYQPSVGSEMAVRLSYRQRGNNLFYRAYPQNFTLIGQSWYFPWRSVVYFDSRADDGAQTFSLFTAVGSNFPFSFTDSSSVSDPNYFTHATLERVVDPMTSDLTSVKIHFPDGSYDVYGLAITNSDGVGSSFTITSKFDAVGHETQIEYFTYDPDTQKTIVKRVIDPDTHALTFTYDTTSGRTNYVTQITDFASRTTKFKTDSTYNTLLEITDAIDITNKMTYDGSGIPATLVTPYGTTSFENLEYRGGHTETRIFTVTEPTGGKQRYLYWTSDAWVPDVLDPNGDSYTTPSGTPYDTFSWYTVDANSYYWNAKNFEGLSSNFKNDPSDYLPTSTDLLIGRGRHWLGTYTDGGGVAVGQTLAEEIDPSPDAITEGQLTFYDHAGGAVNFVGTQIKPGVIARVMPDGSTWYRYITYTDDGKPLEEIEKWVENGTDKYRTNSYTYASNGIDLVEHRFKAASGVNKLIAGYGYNANHQLTSETNALNEIATWTYDGNSRLVTYTDFAGMVSSNTFGGDGFASKTVVYEAGIGPVSTNQYTWINGNLQTQTDARSLMVSNTWDSLNRLTRVDYPDGSFMQHAYTNGSGTMLLDRTYTRDRMTNITKWTYTPLRKVESVTDPRGNVTLYQYCDCGALETVTRAYGTVLAESTDYFYDNQIRLKEIDYPNGSLKTNAFDLLGRVTITGDPLGTSTNTYDNLGRMVASSNVFGQISASVYDAEGNVTSHTDANGVTVAMTYDDLDRIRARTFPDSGVESFGYTANVRGLTSYTNKLSKVTTYAYDKLGRKKTEIVVGLSTNSFTFAPASELLTLNDGKSQTTSWAYDIYGHVATKKYADGNTNLIYSYDAVGRLTNRWSAAKGNTKYQYDANGNLTKIDYPSSADITMAYDALNRSTNEVVASTFTNLFTYFPGGIVATEDGPWPSDTITYMTNTTGLRSAMTIQQPTGSFTNGYTYDAAHRLTNLTCTAGAFIYDYYPTSGGYTAATRLIRKISLPSGSYVTNRFDSNARELETRLMTSANAELNDHTYTYNVGNQRTQQTYTDDTYVTYTYDEAGELRTAYSTNSSGAEIASQRYLFGYDAAWNMTKRTNNASVSTYAFNNLNEDTSTYSTYDSNGNPTAGGSVVLEWDDENRLTAYQVTGISRVEFKYDARNRMRKRIELSWSGTTWTSSTETWYVYDGMLAVQERSSANTPQTTYTRGIDLSVSLAGAGGIGGLLGRSTGYNAGTGAWGTHQFYHADGNGNITYLETSAQALAASYRYDPFGRAVTSSGTSATANLYRFSSKEINTTSGLYYYGYRFYDPNRQRWLNRDPIAEEDGSNVYKFVSNDPIDVRDILGLRSCKEICADAASNPDVNQGESGSVICEDGKKCPCPLGFPKYGNMPGDCPLLDEIVKQHEKEHEPEVDCPSKCPIKRAPWKPKMTGPDKEKSECDKAKEDVKRLSDALNNERNSNCAEVMERVLEDKKHYIQLHNCK